MKRNCLLFMAFTLLTLACNAVTRTFPTNPTATAANFISDGNCEQFQPTQQEIDLARQYDDSYFPESDWKISYTVMKTQVSVARYNDRLGSVINFDYVIFCRVTSAALDDYYTSDTFNVIFQYYDAHAAQKDCRSNSLRLYEFKVKNNGFDYNARFWVEILDENHVRQSLVVFPIEDSVNLDSYSNKIKPELPSCE